jgi:hypothetical protein
MKFSLVFAILLCAHGVLAFSISSLQIEAEIRRSMLTLDAVFSAEADNITACIQNVSESYYQAYESLRDDVTVMLEAFGPRGELYSHRLEKDANEIIESFKKEFNSDVLQSRVVGGIRAVEKRFSEDLLKEVRVLQSAVDDKPHAIDCWNSNKGKLNSIFKNVFVLGREATYSNIDMLDSQIVKVVKKIDNAIARVGKHLLKNCGYKGKCILAYVSIGMFGYLYGILHPFVIVYFSSTSIIPRSLRSSRDIATKQSTTSTRTSSAFSQI